MCSASLWIQHIVGHVNPRYLFKCNLTNEAHENNLKKNVRSLRLTAIARDAEDH